MNKFMEVAIKEAMDGVRKKHGGPFGAVIVKDGEIIASAHNMVIKDSNPTAHAEIEAIKKAGKKLKNYNLSGCELYTTCEPCPMCYSAIYWARISKVYYGADRKDAERIGFDDKHISDVLSNKGGDREIIFEVVDRDVWKSLENMKKMENTKNIKRPERVFI
jgi:guanine deaminase